MKLQFDPPFPPLQTGVLALLIIGGLLTLFARRNRGHRATPVVLFALRGAVALLLLAILLNPVVHAAQRQPGTKPLLLMLLDTSRSMNTPDVTLPDTGSTKTTRWKAAQSAVLDNHALLATLSLRYDLRFYGFDASALPKSVETLRELERPNGDRTSIGEALSQALNGAFPAAQTPGEPRGSILLVSDGRDNGAGYPLEAARTAKASGVPLSTLCLGQERKDRDIQLLARRPQVVALPGQSVELGAELRSSGLDGSVVRVDLLKEGRRVGSREIVTRAGSQEITFPVTETTKGFYRYAMVASVAPGETNALNNRTNIFLNVMDTRARVLLLEGEPSWDAKFLAQTLREDPAITLDSIFQLTGQDRFALSGSPDRPVLRVPQVLDDFTQYDVLLLGKGYESFFDAASTEALKRWVSERGGHVVFLRGRADARTPALQDLEPVTYSDQEIQAARVQLTEAGRSHPGFTFNEREDAQTIVRKLPSLISATRVQGEKALAVVLARAQEGENDSDANTQEMALVAYQRYGQGKSVTIVGQGMWRWAFLPQELESYGHVYAEFWTQMIRWLVSESDFLPGQNIALHTDRTSYARKEAVNFLGYLRGVKPSTLPPITLTLPDGKTTRLVTAPAHGNAADFTAVYNPLKPGEYVATIPPLSGNPKALPVSCAFTVFPGQEEDENRSADPDLMRQLAAVGGGLALTPSELSSLPDRLRAAERLATRIREPHTAWDSGGFLALLVGLLAAEWLLRRRAGLT